jgi:hypothetical protein
MTPLIDHRFEIWSDPAAWGGWLQNDSHITENRA